MRGLWFLVVALSISVSDAAVRYLHSRPQDTRDGSGTLADPWTNLTAAFDPVNGLSDGDELRIKCGEYAAFWGETPMYAINVSILGGVWDQGPQGCTPVIRSAFMFRRLSGVFTNIVVRNLQFESGKALRFEGPDEGPATLDNIRVVNCSFYQRGISAGVVKFRDIGVGPGGLLFEDVKFETDYPLIDTAWFSISYLTREAAIGPTTLRNVKAYAYGFAQPLTLEFRNGSNIIIEDSEFHQGSYVGIYRCHNVRVSRCRFNQQGLFLSRVPDFLVENNYFDEVGDFVAHILLRPVSILIGSTVDFPITRLEIRNNTFTKYKSRSLHDPLAAIEFSGSISGHGYIMLYQQIKGNRFLLQGITGVFAITNGNIEADNNGTVVDASGNWFGSPEGPRDEWCNPNSLGTAINPDPVNNATLDSSDFGSSGVLYRPWCTNEDCTETEYGVPTCVVPGARDGKWRLALGIGLGVSLAIIAAIFIALVLFRYRLQRSQAAALRLLDDYTSLRTRLWDDITSVQDLLARNNILYINYSDIQFGKQLGVGSYGKVTAGVVTVPKQSRNSKSRASSSPSSTSLLGNLSPDMVSIPVAIKELHQSALETYETIHEFLGEVNVMSRFDHPNLLRLLAISLHEIHEKQSVLLITEMMTSGSLDNVIFATDPEKPKLSLAKQVRIAEDVAHGMLFLHAKQPAVVHRDLKPGNVLLDSQMNAKIADFGLAKTMEKATATMTLRGTPVYLAPECILAGKFSQASDVFAFGVTIYELFSGIRAYANESGGIVNLMHRVAHDGLRPDLQAAKLPSDIEKLISDCLEAEASKRPTFAEILSRLRSFSP